MENKKKYKQSVFLPFIKKYMSLVLSQIDRDPDSPTYGSCDRNFWHLKIRDFSSAILQQCALSLALAYTTPYEESPFYNNKNVREWSLACIKYAIKIQLKDGSFNEYYPNEHGFPPTAFCLYALSEAYQILQIEDRKIVKMLEKAAKWLVSHGEKEALNQEAAACLGLYSYLKIVSDEGIKINFYKKINNLLKKQKPEGYFQEYGGADIGYLSVTLDMLSEYYFQSKNKKLLYPLEKMVNFLSYFIHPDGTSGGLYGSRDTTYFLPNGLQVLANESNENAIFIKNLLYKKDGSMLNAIDDRYWSHYLLHSFWRAYKKELGATHDEIISTRIESIDLHSLLFKDSGLFSLKNENFMTIVATKKNGVFKVFDDKREIYFDTGYRFKKNDAIFVSNWQNSSSCVKCTKNIVEIFGYFHKVSPKVSTPFLHFFLRISAFCFGSSLIPLLKKILILSTRNSKVSLYRKLIFEKQKITIIDEIKSPSEIILEKSPNFSLRHVASGHFFTSSELLFCPIKKIKVLGEKKLIYNFIIGE